MNPYQNQQFGGYPQQQFGGAGGGLNQPQQQFGGAGGGFNQPQQQFGASKNTSTLTSMLQSLLPAGMLSQNEWSTV